MYDDPRYDARQQVVLKDDISGTNTCTASAAEETITDCAKFEFFKRVKLLGMKCVVDTVSSPNQAGEALKLMNGTNQLGDIPLYTVTTATQTQASAGDVCNGTMTADQCMIDANTDLQIDFSGTGTASNGSIMTMGPVSLRLSYQEMFMGGAVDKP